MTSNNGASGALPEESLYECRAVAWDMEGALGLPFIVRENGDILLEPTALDEWWSNNRDAVLAAYAEYHPPTDSGTNEATK